MSIRSIARRLFRSALKNVGQRQILRVEEMEGRINPSTLDAAPFLNTAEGSTTAGAIQFLRTGDTTAALPFAVSASGTATPGLDYLMPMEFEFPAGDAGIIYSIAAFDDLASEGTETGIWSIVAGPGYSVGSSGTATIDLFDNDSPTSPPPVSPPPVLPPITPLPPLPDISAAWVNDGAETGPTSGHFELTRTGDTTQSLYVTVMYGGAAVNGQDYQLPPIIVGFGLGDSKAQIAILPIDDDEYDPAESVTVAIQATPGLYTAINSPSATLTIFDNESLPPPVAVDDGSYSTHSGMTLTITSVFGVLLNDYDPQGDALTAVLETQTAHGTVSLSGSGGFQYIPDAKYVGADSFTYRAKDSTGAISNPAVVLLTTFNTAPVANNDFYPIGHGKTLVVPAAGLLGNDFDAEGDPLAIASLGSIQPTGAGTVSVQGDGSFGFTPDANFIGQVTFSYAATDTFETSNQAIATISVLGDRPVANDDQYNAALDSVLSVPVSGVLTNDFSSELGATLSAILETGPANGTLSLSANGSFVYTPNAGFYGTDSFTYRASLNGLLSVNAAMVNINVVKIALTVQESGFVPINGNNDNGSVLVNTALVPKSVGIPTIRDYQSNAPLAAADPELKKVTVAVNPLPQNGIYVLTVENNGTGRVRLWKDARKTQRIYVDKIPSTTFTAANLPTEFHVEGIEMTSATNGGANPDVKIKLTFISFNLPGANPATVEVGVGTTDITVTPVVTSMFITPGQVITKNTATLDANGKPLFSLGMVTAPRQLPNGTMTNAGADTTATLFTPPNMPGAPTLVQVMGYSTAGNPFGVPAFVNGSGSPFFGPEHAMTFVNGGKTTTRDGAFVEDNNFLVADGSKVLAPSQMLDSAARSKAEMGMGEPTRPDYQGQTQPVTVNSITTIRAVDTPGLFLPDILAVQTVAPGFQSMALRFNLRQYLMWRYPAANGQPSILFTLGYLDWTVFFRGDRDPNTGLLVPTAEAGITVGSGVLDHANPAVLAAPDFNLHFFVKKNA